MFAEGSVYDQQGDDGVRRLVMRTWPRGIAYERVDVWLKELGPTRDLLRLLAANQTNWAQFAVSYQQQREERPATAGATIYSWPQEDRRAYVLIPHRPTGSVDG